MFFFQLNIEYLRSVEAGELAICCMANLSGSCCRGSCSGIIIKRRGLGGLEGRRKLAQYHRPYRPRGGWHRAFLSKTTVGLIIRPLFGGGESLPVKIKLNVNCVSAVISFKSDTQINKNCVLIIIIFALRPFQKYTLTSSRPSRRDGRKGTNHLTFRKQSTAFSRAYPLSEYRSKISRGFPKRSVVY